MVTLTVNHLYQAQRAGDQSVNHHWLPCYSTEYVQSQQGLLGGLLLCYSRTYSICSAVSHGFRETGRVIAFIVGQTAKGAIYAIQWAGHPLKGISNRLIGRPLNAIFNAVYPINPINNHRHLVLLPRRVEQFLRDWLPPHQGMTSLALLEGTKETMGSRVTAVVERLSHANESLLNPPNEYPFHYRADTKAFPIVNAFATFAGEMVVFDQLVKDLHGSIESKSLRETEIQLADGSRVAVDLSSVTLDDVLAGVLGHEMTHIASRHIASSRLSFALLELITTPIRLLLVSSMKKHDPIYQDLKEREETGQLNTTERVILSWKRFYFDSIDWILQAVEQSRALFASRQCEYEADTTGAFFMARANFNPLGALYVHELFLRQMHAYQKRSHKYFEFLMTHPYGEHRKQALLAVIHSLAPEALRGRISIRHQAGALYNPEKNQAVQSALDLQKWIASESSLS